MPNKQLKSALDRIKAQAMTVFTGVNKTKVEIRIGTVVSEVLSFSGFVRDRSGNKYLTTLNEQAQLQIIKILVANLD